VEEEETPGGTEEVEETPTGEDQDELVEDGEVEEEETQGGEDDDEVTEDGEVEVDNSESAPEWQVDLKMQCRDAFSYIYPVPQTSLTDGVRIAKKFCVPFIFNQDTFDQAELRSDWVDFSPEHIPYMFPAVERTDTMSIVGLIYNGFRVMTSWSEIPPPAMEKISNPKYSAVTANFNHNYNQFKEQLKGVLFSAAVIKEVPSRTEIDGCGTDAHPVVMGLAADFPYADFKAAMERLTAVMHSKNYSQLDSTGPLQEKKKVYTHKRTYVVIYAPT
jgi:hypothetical protein